MRYFTLNSNHSEKWICFSEEKQQAHLIKLDMTSSKDASHQTKIKIDWIEEGGEEEKWLDIHTCSPIFSVMSLKAENCLRKFLKPNGFLISTIGLKNNYVIYNVTTVLENALDWDSSKINGDRNHLSQIHTAALYKNKIQDTHIFKIGESRVDIFVSEEFKNEVEKYKLTGFVFKEIILR